MSTMTLLADKVGRISLYFFDLVFDIIDKIIHRSHQTKIYLGGIAVMSDLIISSLYDKMKTVNFNVYGLLDATNKIHTLGTDSKIRCLSNILETNL